MISNLYVIIFTNKITTNLLINRKYEVHHGIYNQIKKLGLSNEGVHIEIKMPGLTNEGVHNKIDKTWGSENH